MEDSILNRVVCALARCIPWMNHPPICVHSMHLANVPANKTGSISKKIWACKWCGHTGREKPQPVPTLYKSDRYEWSYCLPFDNQLTVDTWENHLRPRRIDSELHDVYH